MDTKLKSICQEKGISGQRLSFDSRVSASDISKIQRGLLKPYPGQAQRIADALEWDGDPAELFEEYDGREIDLPTTSNHHKTCPHCGMEI